MWLAARKSHKIIVNILAQYGINVNNTCNFNSDTMLHYTAYRNNDDMAEFLLTLGVDSQKRNLDGLTFVDVARTRKHHHFAETFKIYCHQCDEDKVRSSMMVGSYAILSYWPLDGKPVPMPVEPVKTWREMFDMPLAYENVVSSFDINVQPALLEYRQLAYQRMELPHGEAEFSNLINAIFASGNANVEDDRIEMWRQMKMLAMIYRECVEDRHCQSLMQQLVLQDICPTLEHSVYVRHYAALLKPTSLGGDNQLHILAMWCGNAYTYAIILLCLHVAQSHLRYELVDKRSKELLDMLKLYFDASADLRLLLSGPLQHWSKLVLKLNSVSLY